MRSLLIGLLAETSIHPGSGSAGGLIDLPVAREVTTSYPFLAGSGLKGALRQWAPDAGIDNATRDSLFGKPESAGALLISDARILLLPVRSLDASYRWATSPHLLERLHRDAHRAGVSGLALDAEYAGVLRGTYLGVPANDRLPLFLEERQFTHGGDADVVPAASALQRLLPTDDSHANTKKRLARQLLILHDDDFTWFARNALPVSARNQLDDEKKTSNNLWYEESLAPDSLLYAVVAERMAGALDKLKTALERHPNLQVGGNETVGMGWCTLHVVGTGT